MILLNFSHPLTTEQLDSIRTLTAQEEIEVRDVRVQLEPQGDFVVQLCAFAEAARIAPHTWQTERILVNPPALNFIAAGLLAELHGRMGYFPPILRLRPIPGAMPPRYEVAEIVNLQAIRDEARHRRA